MEDENFPKSDEWPRFKPEKKNQNYGDLLVPGVGSRSRAIRRKYLGKFAKKKYGNFLMSINSGGKIKRKIPEITNLFRKIPNGSPGTGGTYLPLRARFGKARTIFIKRGALFINLSHNYGGNSYKFSLFFYFPGIDGAESRFPSNLLILIIRDSSDSFFPGKIGKSFLPG